MASWSRVLVAETAVTSGVGGADGLARLPSECEGLQAQRQMVRFMLAGQIAIPEGRHAEASLDCFGVIQDWLKSGNAHGKELGVRQYLNWMRAQATVGDIIVRAAEVELGTADGRRRANNASRAQTRGDITLSVLIELLDEVRAERAKQVGQTEGASPTLGPAPPLPASTTIQPVACGTITGLRDPPADQLNLTPPDLPDRSDRPEEEERTRAG